MIDAAEKCAAAYAEVINGEVSEIDAGKADSVRGVVDTLGTILNNKTIRTTFTNEFQFQAILTCIVSRVWEARLSGAFCDDAVIKQFLPQLIPMTQGTINMAQRGHAQNDTQEIFKLSVREYCSVMNMEGKFVNFLTKKIQTF